MRGGVRLRRGVQRLAVAAARRAPGSWRVPRLLSVVVTVRDGDAALDECLASLRRQHYRACEFVVVDLGLPASAVALVDRHAREDVRVRMIAAAGDLATGRNRGAEAATGEFLAFLDADDAVTPHGYALAVDALRGSGSDLAVFAERPYRRGHPFPVPDRVRLLHGEPHLGVSLESLPDALANTVTGARVFRRRAYDEHRLRFAGLPSCDDAHSVTAYRSSTAFDVLPHVGLLRREESDRSALTRTTPDLAGLRRFRDGVTAALAELPDHLARVYAAEVLAAPLAPFLDRAWRCPDDYWEELRAVVTSTRHAAGSEALGRVPAYRKVLGSLIEADERDRARRLLTEVRPSPRRCPTRVADLDGVRVVVAELGPDWASVPEADRVLSRLEISVRAEVTSVRAVTTDSVELRGWAFLDNVDLTHRTPEVRLVLRSPDGRSVGLPVTQVASPEADVAGDLLFADVTPSGFVAVLDTGELVGPPGVWRLHAEVAVDGLDGHGRVVIRPWTMAGVFAWSDGLGRAFFVDHDDAGRFELHLTPRHDEVAVTSDGDRISLALSPDVRSVTLQPRDPGRTPFTVAVDRATGRVGIPLDRLSPDTRYAVRARGRSGRAHDVLRPGDADLADPRIRPDRRGVLTVSASGRSAEAQTVEAAGESLVVRMLLPRAASAWETALVVGDTAVTGELTRLTDELAEARYPLARTSWGHPDLPLPSGTYAVAVRNAEAPDWAPVRPSADLAGELPLQDLQDRLRLRVEVFAPDDPGVRVVIGPPLADDELGQRHQRRLREASAVEVADRDSVFFRAMFSEFANGNGLGVHEELVRRGSPLALHWSVADRSVPVPAGGVGVVEGSRAWHEAVARARYHLVDVHQLEWFRRPRDQVLIQTMHGYPYKVMGHDWWEKMGNSVQEIGSLDRRAREWSVLVSPAPYATPLLRRAFLEPAGADVRVLETGYPRNDALLLPDAVRTRVEARSLLGLPDDAVAVLYAPTFRDYLSPEDRTARTVDFLDAEEALERLPDGYVLLMRGHAFNARIRSDRVRSTSRVIDVTDHPDVNHLILASDVAVLDYSSIRFDYVLSGHPMIFLVPDLEEYDRTRGGVIPYAPTAPGPHVSSTGEVVAWLTDLPRLTAEFAEARERFRADFVGLEDGHSAARLVDAVFAPRGDG